MCDPTIRQPGFNLPRQQWSLLNRFRTEQGHCGACSRKWRLTDTDLCPCGETQTMSHIVESCPLTKLNGSLSRLHSADEDAVFDLPIMVNVMHTRRRRSSLYYYDGAQRYEQFLQVGRLYRDLILLGLAVFQAPLCRQSSWCYIDINFFLLTSFSLPFSELSVVGLALDLVDYTSSFSAMTLLVGSFDP